MANASRRVAFASLGSLWISVIWSWSLGQLFNWSTWPFIMLMRRWRCCCSCSFYLRIIINYNVALSPLSLSIFPPSLVVVVATLLLCVLTQQLKHLCKHCAEKSPIHWTLDSGQCRPHRLSRSNPAVSSSHHVQINHTQWGASKMSRWQMIREQKSNKKYSNFKFFMILPDSICIHREREREGG